MTSIKEKILEEFDKLEGLTFGSKEDKRESYKQFLSQAIDQTREETIREVEEITEERIVRGKFLPDLADPNSYYSGLYNGYQEIRQSLKSLINK